MRLLLMALIIAMAAGLAYAILSLPAESAGLSVYTTENIAISGVTNPVTAVLLNYRAYDTFLELGVLLLALLGVWSLGSTATASQRPSAPGPVLDNLARVLVPILIVVAGYLFWAGAYIPGGAFQAGAVLGAAGVLLILAGWRINHRLVGLPLRISLVLGLVVFAVVGTLFMLTDRQFLEFPPQYAGVLILLIEGLATLSIGIALAALFLGADPEEDDN
ncbi:MAG: sodium:proton antiporter [Methylophaga sp.]|nr:MAG: sodium:proton antiporter [Methylophaga sp.]